MFSGTISTLGALSDRMPEPAASESPQAQTGKVAVEAEPYSHVCYANGAVREGVPSVCCCPTSSGNHTGQVFSGVAPACGRGSLRNSEGA